MTSKFKLGICLNHFSITFFTTVILHIYYLYYCISASYLCFIYNDYAIKKPVSLADTGFNIYSLQTHINLLDSQ
jgi:hypothetical protein